MMSLNKLVVAWIAINKLEGWSCANIVSSWSPYQFSILLGNWILASLLIEKRKLEFECHVLQISATITLLWPHSTLYIIRFGSKPIQHSRLAPIPAPMSVSLKVMCYSVDRKARSRHCKSTTHSFWFAIATSWLLYMSLEKYEGWSSRERE